MKTNNLPSILDTSIRDGSYVFNFKFTKEDTFLIARGLSNAGIKHIEVGHGLGLKASEKKGNAAEKDSVYIKSARDAVSEKSLIGCFFIPGIGDFEAIHSAVDAGLQFIRIGIDIDEYKKLDKYIEFCKSFNLEVWVNLMKTYLVKPKKFGEIVRYLENLGVDVISIVDSAGGMLPKDIEAYTYEGLNAGEIPLAFHGHDNLTLAVSNCLKFIECGGKFVDCSLCGLGRGAGNASTEILAGILKKMNLLSKEINNQRLLELAENYKNFLSSFKPVKTANEISIGLNLFHSGNEKLIIEAQNITGVSFSQILNNLPQSSKKYLTINEAIEAGQKVKLKEKKTFLNLQELNIQRLQPENIEELKSELEINKGKTSLIRVISLSITNNRKTPHFGPIRKGHKTLISHIEINNESDFEEIFHELEDYAELWLIDKHIFSLKDNIIKNKNKKIYIYDDRNLIKQAVIDYVQILSAKKIRIIGDSYNLKKDLKNYSEIVDNNMAPECLIITDENHSFEVEEYVKRAKESTFIIFTTSLNLDEGTLSKIKEKNISLLKINCSEVLISEADRIAKTINNFNRTCGEKLISPNLAIVSGGFIGKKGSIIVDDINNPRFIYGVCDGRGNINKDLSENNKLINEWIINHWDL